MRVVIASVVLLAVASAAQAANTAELAFPRGYDSMAFAFKADIAGQLASDFRRAIDGQGDGDGQVTASEAAAFSARNRSQFSQSNTVDLKDGNITLDGSPPTEVLLGNITVLGATGAVGSQNPVVLAMDFELTFHPRSGSTHSLLMKGGGGTGQSGGQVTTTIRAAPGTIIQSASGVGGVSADGSHITFVMDSSAPSITVVFGRPGAAAPSTALVGLVAVLACATLVRRR